MSDSNIKKYTNDYIVVMSKLNSLERKAIQQLREKMHRESNWSILIFICFIFFWLIHAAYK